MALSFACLLTFLLAVNTAFGLICYKCDSSESSICSHGITRFMYDTVDCQKEHGGGFVDAISSWIPKSCVKITAKGEDGSEYVARGCVPSVGQTGCDAMVKTLSFFSNVQGGAREVNCYPCEGDKCNSAHKFTGLTFAALILAAVAFLF